MGSKLGIVEKAGSWYSYNKDRIGQGKDNVRAFLKENPEIAEDIENQIRAQLLTKQPHVKAAEKKEDATA